MPTSNNHIPISDVTIEDSNHFISRTSGLWQNASDKVKRLLQVRKDISPSVLDEITPPGNRLSHKSFSSNNKLNNNSNSIVSDTGSGLNNNSHVYSDVYNHTPINGNRSENVNTTYRIQSPHKKHPSSTTSYKTATIPQPSCTTTKKCLNNEFEAFYDMHSLHPPKDIFYPDSWCYNYHMGSANDSYKPTITPPKSIDEHVSLLGESFSKMSTGSNMIGEDLNFYNNFYIKENTSNNLALPGVSKLPHPSFTPQTTAKSNNQLSYCANGGINADVQLKYSGNKSFTPDFQQFSQSNDLYQLRPIYDFHTPENCNANTATNYVVPNPNKSYLSWMGKLSAKSHPDPIYSNKVFLGGLPWDITEQGLYVVFKQFGPCTFEWPGKDNRSTRHPPKGYVYLIFENERSVKTLLQYCHHDEQRTQFYFKLKTHTTNNEKSIQIIPWNLANSSYLKCSSERLDITKTVFVGGLHGKITAENLAVVFEELFGHVIYAGIDTDKNKYPIGSGRVTFDNFNSYRNAIQASFVQINGKNFCKKVQIDPYLEDSICQLCTQKNGPFFCKDFDCLQYFCKDCWIIKHCNPEKSQLVNHRPINRQNSSDIFEILNSIQYYSQISNSSATKENLQLLSTNSNNISTEQLASTKSISTCSEKSVDLNLADDHRSPDSNTSK